MLSPRARSPPLRSARSVPACSRRKSADHHGELSSVSQLLAFKFAIHGASSSTPEASSGHTSPATRASLRSRPSVPLLEPFCENVSVPAWAADDFSRSGRSTPWACAAAAPASLYTAARGAPAVQTPPSSSASTRVPSPPGTPSTSGGAALPSPHCLSVAHRLLLAERAQLEKDLRIEALESRVRELESNFGGSRSGNSSSCGSLTNSSRPSHPGLREAVRCTVFSDADNISEGSLDADVDAAVQKSEELLKKMSALDALDEPEMQWAAMMSAHEETKDKLSQIEMLVQRRIDSLRPADPELRLCRAVRGLCVGSQRTLPRRWALSSSPGSPRGSNSELQL